MILSQPHLIKIRKGPLYIMAALFFIFIIFIPVEPGKAFFKNYIIAGGLLVFILSFYLLDKTKITLDNKGMTVSRIFSKTTNLTWNEVHISEWSWEIEGGHTANIYWTFVGDENKKIILQPSFYARKDLRLIAELLVAKSLGARISSRIRKIADGKFPWYLF